jgi:predicted RNA methylase
MEALDRIKFGIQGSLEEIVESISAELKRKKEQIPQTTFIENTLLLPIQLRKVYFTLLMNDKLDAESLSEMCDIDNTKTKRILFQLVQSGLIKSVKEKGDKKDFYFILQERDVPRMQNGIEHQMWKNFLGPPMPPIYQYNLLCDAPRVKALQKAILKTVTKNDVVVDLGTGTGILSLIAAKKAKKVYAIEMDPFMLEVAKNLASYYPEGKKIEFVEADARTFHLNEKADVIICEMLDTALIREYQVPAMNHALENIAKENARIIPLKSTTKIELVQADFHFYGFDFPIPYYEKCGARNVKDVLSQQTEVHMLRFDEVNSPIVRKDIHIKISKDGIANAFRLLTYVHADEEILMKPSDWLNPPLVFPIKWGKGGKINVKKGEELQISLWYEMGTDIEYMYYSII